MFLKGVSCSLIASAVVSLHGACSTSENPPTPTPRTMNATVRHIEPGGIGYTLGYSSLDTFFSFKQGRDISLLDLRGHVFNNGKFAANAGAGFRILSGCRSYGINTYYDYRDTTHQHFSQIGIGFETLGNWWDLGINGYFPIGDKKSHGFDEHGSDGHKSKKVEIAMKGGDALLGFPLMELQDIILNGAIGPYYYRGHEGVHAVGGKAQIRLQWKQYFSLAVYGSYDNLFHARVQGEIAFTYPFGPRVRKGKRENCSARLFQSVTQKVNRNEIIVVGTKKSEKKI